MRDKIIRFLDMTGFDGLIKNTVEVILGQFENGIRSLVWDDIEKGEKLAELSRSMEMVRSALWADFPAFRDAIIGIYEKHFSPEELDAILAFYATPAGAKLLHIGSVLQGEINDASDRWSTGVLTRTEAQVMSVMGLSSN